MSAARRRACPLLLAGTLGVGCAARQKTVVVLLPEEGTASAKVEVTNRRGTEVLSQPFQSSEVRAADKSPGKPRTMDEGAVQRTFGDALGALPTPPVRFQLYFESDSTELTAESRELLPRLLETVAARSPAAVSVVGHTDTVGAPERNHGLGLGRAEAVASLLRSLGLTATIVETSSHGEADLLVATEDETAEPRNRRVEVTVR